MKKIFPLRLKNVPFRKYILYALGEMVLIVISLFFALQLNNLNESRKNNNRIERYKLILLDDLQKDLKQLKETMSKFAVELEEIDGYRERLNSPEVNIESLIKIAKDEFNPNIPPFVRYSRNTWEAMKATGDIGLLDQEVLNAFNALHELQNEEKFYQKLSLSLHIDLLEAYFQNYAIRTGLIHKGALYEKAWEDINQNDLILTFNALLTIKLSALEGAMRYYEKIETEILKVIELLEK